MKFRPDFSCKVYLLLSTYSARQRCRRFLHPHSSRRRARRDPRLMLWLVSTCCAFQLRRLRVSIGHMLPLHAQPIRSCEPDQLQVIPLENDRFRGRPGGRPAAVFEFLSLSPRSRRAAKLRASRVAHYETYSPHRMYDIELHRSFGTPCAAAPPSATHQR